MTTAEMEQPRLLGISDATGYLRVFRQTMRIAVIQDQVEWVRIGQLKMISTAVLARMLERHSDAWPQADPATQGRWTGQLPEANRTERRVWRRGQDPVFISR